MRKQQKISIKIIDIEGYFPPVRMNRAMTSKYGAPRLRVNHLSNVSYCKTIGEKRGMKMESDNSVNSLVKCGEPGVSATISILGLLIS